MKNRGKVKLKLTTTFLYRFWHDETSAVRCFTYSLVWNKEQFYNNNFCKAQAQVVGEQLLEDVALMLGGEEIQDDASCSKSSVRP